MDEAERRAIAEAEAADLAASQDASAEAEGTASEWITPFDA